LSIPERGTFSGSWHRRIGKMEPRQVGVRSAMSNWLPIPLAFCFWLSGTSRRVNSFVAHQCGIGFLRPKRFPSVPKPLASYFSPHFPPPPHPPSLPLRPPPSSLNPPPPPSPIPPTFTENGQSQASPHRKSHPSKETHAPGEFELALIRMFGEFAKEIKTARRQRGFHSAGASPWTRDGSIAPWPPMARTWYWR